MPALVLIVLVVLIGVWLNSWGKKTRRKMLDRAVQAANGGQPLATTYRSELDGIRALIAMDVEREQIAIANLVKGSVIRFSNIIRVEPLFDGSPVQHGGTGATTGAVVGLALAGGLGAVIGAMAGSGRKVRKLSLRIVTADLAEPVKEVAFLNSGSA